MGKESDEVDKTRIIIVEAENTRTHHTILSTFLCA